MRVAKERSLRTHILVVVLLGMLPLLGLGLLLIAWNAQVQRRLVEQVMLQAASALSHAVDQELRSTASALQALAAGQRDAPTPVLAARAGELLAGQEGWSAVTLGDRAEGRVRQLVPPAAAGGAGDPFTTAERALQADQPATSGLYRSPVQNTWVTSVQVPLADGRRTVGATLTSAHWVHFLRQQDVPEGWVAGIIDREGVLVARSRLPEQFVGRTVPDWIRSGMRGTEGRLEGPSLEGQPIALVYHRSVRNGWAVEFAAPVAVFTQPLARALQVAALAGVAFTLAAALLAWLYARRIIAPAEALTRSVVRQEGGGALPSLPPGPLREINHMYVALVQASARAAEESAARSRAEIAAQHAGELAEAAAQRQELEMAARELERANATKSQFLANVSHELRTPLNAIIGFSELMKDGLAGPLQEQQREFVGEILSSGRHLLSLINDILDLSKVETGAMALQLEPVHMDTLAQSSLSVVRETARSRGVRLEAAVAADVGTFLADTRKVKQLLYNLLSNAVKFTPQGGAVRVEAQVVSRAAAMEVLGRRSLRATGPLVTPSAHLCEIVVRDTGIGIAAEDLHRLFQPFVQIDSSLGRQHEGTGLGLALVKNLAQLHGGTVGVESVPGQGSTFHVWLPLLPCPPGSEEIDTSQEPAVVVRRSELALVVEDDEGASIRIESELEREGFRVLRVHTAEEALFMAERHRPGVITLDVFLPFMDGWEFLRRMNERPAIAGTPVVVITVAPDAEHGFSFGATRVLHKPFEADELHDALAGLFGSSSFLGLESAPAPLREQPGLLIVDDNPSAIRLLADAVAPLDVRVLRAYTAEEALAVARRGQPRLIVVDLLLQGTSGVELIRQLQLDAATRDIPLIVVSSRELTESDRELLNGRVLQVLAKSVLTPDRFRLEVARALKVA